MIEQPPHSHRVGGASVGTLPVFLEKGGHLARGAPSSHRVKVRFPRFWELEGTFVSKST